MAKKDIMDKMYYKGYWVQFPQVNEPKQKTFDVLYEAAVKSVEDALYKEVIHIIDDVKPHVGMWFGAINATTTKETMELHHHTSGCSDDELIFRIKIGEDKIVVS